MEAKNKWYNTTKECEKVLRLSALHRHDNGGRLDYEQTDWSISIHALKPCTPPVRVILLMILTCILRQDVRISSDISVKT